MSTLAQTAAALKMDELEFFLKNVQRPITGLYEVAQSDQVIN